jgi:hypothetical protein
MAEELRTDRRNKRGDNPPVKGGGKRKNRDSRREARMERAVLREVERSKREDWEQLARLEAAGHGQCREAKRLRGAA